MLGTGSGGCLEWSAVFLSDLRGLVETAPLGIFPLSRTPLANLELDGMGVTCQHQVDVGLWQYLAAPMGWVVRQEDAVRRLGGVGDDLSGFLQVSVGREGWFADVLDAEQGDALGRTIRYVRR